GDGRVLVTGNWWTLTRLVVQREIRERTQAKSFWIASVILLVAVAAGAIIPALLSGHRPTARVGIVGSNIVALTQTAMLVGRISGTMVNVVTVSGAASAKAQLRSGNLDGVLVGDSEVLVKQRPAFGTSSPGATLVGALSAVAGFQKAFAELPPAA